MRSTNLFVVVDFTVVNHPYVRHRRDTNRLHTVQIVDDGQTMKAKSTVWMIDNILKSKAIRATMGYLKATRDLLVNIDITAEYTPDTAHFTLIESFRWKKIKQKKRLKSLEKPLCDTLGVIDLLFNNNNSTRDK